MNMNIMNGRWRRSTLVVKNMIRSTPTGANNCCTFLLHTTHCVVPFFCENLFTVFSFLQNLCDNIPWLRSQRGSSSPPQETLLDKSSQVGFSIGEQFVKLLLTVASNATTSITVYKRSPQLEDFTRIIIGHFDSLSRAYFLKLIQPFPLSTVLIIEMLTKKFKPTVFIKLPSL